MRTDRDVLLETIQKNKISEIIVGYLKLQQAKNNDFYNLFRENKINGRLFYNTSLPNGTKEVRLSNEDFTGENFRAVIDSLLAPFSNITIENIRAEFMAPTEISLKMNSVISQFLADIESNPDWKKFWEREINLSCSLIEKKKLYNLIASNAAYKALVSCIDYSKVILDPIVKRNVATLIGICTGRYESKLLEDKPEFSFNQARQPQDKLGEFGVFKAKTLKKRRKVKAGQRTKIKKRSEAEVAGTAITMK